MTIRGYKIEINGERFMQHLLPERGTGDVVFSDVDAAIPYLRAAKEINPLVRLVPTEEPPNTPKLGDTL